MQCCAKNRCNFSKHNYFSDCINYEQEKCISTPGTIHKDSTRCVCKVCWGELDGQRACLHACSQETSPFCKPRMAAVHPETWKLAGKVWASSSPYRLVWAVWRPKLCKQIHNLCICSAAHLYTEVCKLITGTKSVNREEFFPVSFVTRRTPCSAALQYWKKLFRAATDLTKDDVSSVQNR